MRWAVREGDCVEVMAGLPEACVDAVVTDPPYGLEFMGKEWDRLTGVGSWANGSTAPGYTDGGERLPRPAFGSNRNPMCRSCRKHQRGRERCVCAAPDFDERPADANRAMQEWHERWAGEALRVLKPGGFLLAFGGTRTYHRLACAVEDAGFEIRDSIATLFAIDVNDVRLIMEAWQRWSERVPSAGLIFREQDGDSAGAHVRLATSHAESPARALIAELRSSEVPPTPADRSPSAPLDADASSTASSARVTIAGSRSANREATSTAGSTAPGDAPEWLAASQEAIAKAAEALTIWLGVEQSLKPAATDALCAALTVALKHITCAHSETFRSYDTTWQTVCASATTATTTASTAASLLAFMADTRATLGLGGGDAVEAPGGPLVWVYGSGFPSLKSLDVSKAIDKAAGAEREVVGRDPNWRAQTHTESVYDGGLSRPEYLTAPATPEAERWEGWGTALKPAHEPIVVARKPLESTVAGNVLAHGVGAMNIDGCRIGTTDDLNGGAYSAGGRSNDLPGAERTTSEAGMFADGGGRLPGRYVQPSGRWPANTILVHSESCRRVGTRRAKAGTWGAAQHTTPGNGGTMGDGWTNTPSRDVGVADVDGMEEVEAWECADGCPVKALDEQSGTLTSGRLQTHHKRGGDAPIGTFKIRDRTGEPCDFGGDSGGASRFMYCAKSSSAERNAGLDGFEVVKAGSMEGPNDRQARSSTQSLRDTRLGPGYERPETRSRNPHPTVKPVAVMRWLVRLVTPPGGLVLDPFAGSGSTGIAAVLEGFRFLGIEQQGPRFVAEHPGEPDYVAIAKARIAWWEEHGENGLKDEVHRAAQRRAEDKRRAARQEAGQLGMFDG